jgi:hypothetical protein
MAMSKCPKCDSHLFEMKQAPRISGSNFKLNFIQCSSCGAVVGVVDYFNIPILLRKIAAKLGVSL